MNAKRELYLLITSSISGIVVGVAANYVIRKQEKVIKEFAEFQGVLMEAVHEFMPYVPPAVLDKHLEKVQFDEIVRKYGETSEQSG